MVMNNEMFNPYNMTQQHSKSLLSRSAADVILNARRAVGIYDLGNLENAISTISVEDVYESGNVNLKIICETPDSGTYYSTVSESTVRLIISVISAMVADKDLDWKCIQMVDETFPEPLSETSLFKDYYCNLTSVLDPNTIYIILEIAAILVLLMTYHPEKCDPIWIVSRVALKDVCSEERIQHVVYAIRTLIIGSYKVLYGR